MKSPFDPTESIDVVIPVYNGELYIKDAVESALGQTHAPSQVIVVNDGSTDRTLEILEDLAKLHPKLKVVTKTHGERNAARNAGVKASQANYIGFLDADDIWLPQKLEKQIEVFRNNNDPQLGLVYCDYIAVDLSNQELKNYGGFELDRTVKNWALSKLIDGNKVSSSASGALVKSSCFKSVGLFDETLSYSEDWEMWLRIAEKYKIDYSAEKLVRIRRRPSGPHDLEMDFKFFIGDLKVIQKYLNNPDLEVLACRSFKNRFQNNSTPRKLFRLIRLSLKDSVLRKAVFAVLRRPILASWILGATIENSHFLFKFKHPTLAKQELLQPEVTVVMPVLNAEKYIRTAMDAVLRQTFSNFELLMIDDGSSDGSLETILSFTDIRIRLIKNDHPLGLANSLNLGLQLAKGRFLARINSDDFWSKDHLEEQVKAIRADSGCSLVTCLTDIVDEGGAIVSNQPQLLSPEAYYFTLKFRNCIHTSSTIFRTEVVRKLGGYKIEDSFAEDYGLYLRLSEVGRIIQLRKHLAFRRQHKNARSLIFSKDRAETISEIRKTSFQRLLRDPVESRDVEAAAGQEKLGELEPSLVSIFAKIFPQICVSILNSAPTFYRVNKLCRYVSEELLIQRFQLSLYGVKIYPARTVVAPLTWIRSYLQFLFLYGKVESLGFFLKREHF